MEIKKILVATDFSDEAYNALFYATQIWAMQECTFYILNAYDEATPLTGAHKAPLLGKKKLEKLETESIEALTKISHRITLDTGNKRHTYKTISEQGTLATVIPKTVKKLSIDLVVMGNKGRTGAKEIFMGSNTLKVAGSIDQCPLLAIPKGIDFKPQNNIAFVTDYKKGCNTKTLDPLLAMAAITKAPINVMHIASEEKLSSVQISNKKLLELCLKDVDHSFHQVLEFDDKAKVIDSFIETHNISLLAMVYMKRSFMERLLREPVIKDISLYAKSPFLILPMRE
ncbi:universal stress protein [Maribacter sp. MMG018]|uniref:universal stress protein n=1 Tax=Maribacter sp. MMG018 TaxID=2822688 RepID=UPI001B38A609|nr:universal stress protein [Maribacter sp. MMG018]MBQ4915940.1 universal stress protein [Maribacter sp. MMG018]